METRARKKSRETERNPHTSPWQWVADKIFGYDLFISYSWGDASHYADTLTEDLEKRGFVCFLDKNQYGAGDDLKTAARRALAKTGALVVVLSAEALRSKYVRQEVEIFRPSGRKIIVIDTQDVRGSDPNAELLALVGEDVLDIRKNVGSLEDGPSNSVSTEIAKSFNLTRQELRRTRWLVGIAALLSILFVSAALLAWLADRGRKEAENQRAEAQRGRAEALQQTEIARQRLRVGISKQVAVRAVSNWHEDLTLSLLLAVQGTRIDDNPETRHSLLRVLQRARGIQRFLHPYDTPRDVGMGIGIAPNGRYIVCKIAQDRVATYDTQTDVFRNVRVPIHERWLPAAIASDGKTLAVSRSLDDAHDEGWPNVEIHDTTSGEVQRTYRYEAGWCDKKPCGIDPGIGGAAELTVPVMESTILGDGTVQLIHMGCIQRSRCAANPHWSRLLCMTPDSRPWDEDSPTALLWDLSSCKQIAKIQGCSAYMQTVDFSLDGRLIAGVDKDGKVIVWNANTGKVLFPGSHFNTTAKSITFHPDGKTVAIAGVNGQMGLWEIETGREFLQWQCGDYFPVQKMVFSEDGKRLISVGRANKVTVWDLDALSRVKELVVSDFSLPQDDPKMKTALEEAVEKWRLRTGRTSISAPDVMTVDGPMRLSQNKDLLAVSVGLGATAIIDVRQRHILLTVAYSNEPSYLAFDEDSNLIAVGEGKILRTSFLSGDTRTDTIAKFKESDGKVVAVSPDCSTIVFRGYGAKNNLTFRLWDTRSQSFRAETEPAGRWVSILHQIGFYPTRFVTVEGLSMSQIRRTVQHPDTIRVWDTITGKLATEPLNPEAVLQQSGPFLDSIVALSPDGRYLAGIAPYGDGAVTLFDIDARQPLGGPLWKPEMSTESKQYEGDPHLVFSNDGKILVVARGKRIVLLDTDIESWKFKACRKANRNLTEEEWKRYIGPEIPYEKTCPELP